MQQLVPMMWFDNLSFSADGSRAIVRSFPSKETWRIELVRARTGETVRLWEVRWDSSVGFARAHQTPRVDGYPYPSNTLAPVMSSEGLVALVTQGFHLSDQAATDPKPWIDESVEVLSLDSGKILNRFNVGLGVHIVRGYTNAANTAWVLLGKDNAGNPVLLFWNTKRTTTTLLDMVPDVGTRNVVAFSPDGSLFGAIESGGAVRLWRVSDSGTAVSVARVVGFSSSDWAVVKEDGRYDASRPADIGGLSWVIPTDPFEPLPLSSFYLDFFEPALLTRLLSGELLPQISSMERRERVVPKVSISQIKASEDEDAVDVEVNVAQGDAAAIGDVKLFRDGSLVGTSGITEVASSDPSDYVLAFRNIALPSNRSQAVEFSAYAFNGDGVKSETSVRYIGADHVGTRTRRAFVVSIGVNAHENASWDLRYAADDARAVGKLLGDRLRRSGYFDEVYPIPLISERGRGGMVEGNARREIVLSVLDALGGKRVPWNSDNHIPEFDQLSKATPDDFVFLSFSGHGLNGEDGTFHFVLSDTGPGSQRRVDKRFLSHTLDSDLLASKLLRVDAGGIAMAIDACSSANSIQAKGFRPGPMGSRGLGQLAYDKRMMVIVASQAESVAVESDAIRHGLLSFAMLREGLEGGAADRTPIDSAVSLREMMDYGVERVPALHRDILRDTFAQKGLDSASQAFDPMLEGHYRDLQRPHLFDFSEIRVLMPILLP